MGSLKQDVQQYCLGTVNIKIVVHWRWRWEGETRTSNSIVLELSMISLFTGGGNGKAKPGRQSVLSWNDQHQNCSLDVEVGRLNQDVQNYCLGTDNTKY